MSSKRRAPNDTNKQPIETSVAPDFARAVQEHLGVLQITQSEFASYASLSPADLHRWLSDTRGVTRAAVNQTTMALCRLYDERKPSGNFTRGVDHLDRMLQSLMEAAGYGGRRVTGLDDRDDTTWEHITRSAPSGDRVIKMGWVQCEPWSRGAKGAPAGIAIEVAERVIELLGMRPEWSRDPLEWKDLSYALRRRQIDLIPPFMMQAPWRLADFRFSDPISAQDKHKFGIAALVHRSSKPTSGEKASVLEDFAPMLHIGYVADEIGELARFVLKTNHNPTEHATLQDALSWLREKKNDSDIPRCLVSEESTCEKSKGNDLILVPVEKFARTKFGIAFAAHPKEGLLIRAVNECLPILQPYIDSKLSEVRSGSTRDTK